MKHALILEALQRSTDDKLRASIEALKGVQAAIMVLPGLTECPRCKELAHITRKVKGAYADMPACTLCAQVAKDMGLIVEEIL